MLWIGLILLVIGAVLFFLSTRAATKMHYMQATETSKVGDLLALLAEIKQDMPPGMSTGWRDYVELKGRVACDEPIHGELSATPAAMCETTVQRMVERREERRDAQGNVRTEWRKHTETVSSNRREAPFYLQDDSGRIRVKPTAKAVELVKVIDRFEQPNAIEQMSGGNLVLSHGGFRVSVSSGGFVGGATSRTIGYKFIERILPVNGPLYALGEVADTDDEGLVLREPTDDQKKRPFLVSGKTEEELVRASKRSSRIMKIIAIALAVGGVALTVLGALR
ncbi:MAG: hypothetical protein CVU56_03665 [Deltaproteobacteria bacterium HGW-Deltaproteobacteria-14]|jgi:hypothetical protein|nr:MAG: hypothetical protein CVU56_03665 [Deltaproteobacteria bacterium HGW-Deltaproteobacteria-14]